jgi:hypothetical protein
MFPDVCTHSLVSQVFFAVGKSSSVATLALQEKDKAGYTNQYGLSRKVRGCSIQFPPIKLKPFIAYI